MIRVMIADDQAIVREGLKKILSLGSEIQVVCDAENGFDVLASLSSHTIDVLLMDVRMPKMDGIQAANRIKEQFPKVKILILTTFNEDEYLFEGIKNGISGYLLKDSDIDFILKSIRDVYAGKMVFDPAVTPKLVEAIKGQTDKKPVHTDTGSLTEREIQIGKLVAKGFSNSEIAQSLFLSEGTVKNSISKILKKLDLQRRTQISALFLSDK
jgi:Response regulator containing a CheY-like receiver domain and an HTH DNA-binding domain